MAVRNQIRLYDLYTYHFFGNKPYFYKTERIRDLQSTHNVRDVSVFNNDSFYLIFNLILQYLFLFYQKIIPYLSPYVEVYLTTKVLSGNLLEDDL